MNYKETIKKMAENGVGIFNFNTICASAHEHFFRRDGNNARCQCGHTENIPPHCTINSAGQIFFPSTW